MAEKVKDGVPLSHRKRFVGTVPPDAPPGTSHWRATAITDVAECTVSSIASWHVAATSAAAKHAALMIKAYAYPEAVTPAANVFPHSLAVLVHMHAGASSNAAR